MDHDAQPNDRFVVEVRGRPVRGIRGAFATHCFIALLDARENVVDSLSFDPSNSDHGRDERPTDCSRGRVIVEKACDRATWEKLSAAFKSYANRSPYVLRHHNCCDVVIGALLAAELNNVRAGIRFARAANNMWHWVKGALEPAAYSKKKKLTETAAA
jgi:hypothetical protein